MLRLQMSTQSSYGRIVQGWIAAHNGDTTAGIALTREGFARAEATGSRNYYPLHLGLLAEALATSAASGQKGTDAELYRLRGELVQQFPRPDPAKAEDSFRTALAVAREQGARGYELRAATSLARLWLKQGRRGEARELLAPLYGSFTEGFGTQDLKDAKALLDELV